jgi:hypothetical protein
MATLKVINKWDNKKAENLVNKAFENIKFPAAKILVVLENRPLTGPNIGETLPKQLIRLEPLDSLFLKYRDDWDCCIAISGKIHSMFENFNAYFLQLFGHELGHCHICLYDFYAHIFSRFLELHINKIIGNPIRFPYELPHEKLCEQFGIAIAEKIFSREKLNIEINELIKSGKSTDIVRLKFILKTDNISDLSNLRRELIQFVGPYKKEIIDFWNDWVDKKGDRTILKFIPNIENFLSSLI